MKSVINAGPPARGVPQGLRLVGILLLAAMLSGCLTNPVAEWGPDGITANVDEEAGTAVFSNNLGDDSGEDVLVNLVGCDTSNMIPEVSGNVSGGPYKQKVHVDGWLAASKNFPDGANDAGGGAEAMSVAAVVVKLTEFENASQPENGRFTISKWNTPTGGGIVGGIKARPPGYVKTGDFPQSGWSIVGLVPANENVLKGFAALDWNQKASFEGWLMAGNDSSGVWYPYGVRATENGDCRIFAGTQNGGFSGWMLVTSMTLGEHGTIDTNNAYDPYSVSFIGGYGYLGLLMLAGVGAFVLYAGSTGAIRTGARWSAKQMLSEAQMIAARGMRRELKEAKTTVEEATGSTMDLEKPDVEKRKKLSRLDAGASVELDEFDVMGALRSHRRDPRALGSRQGGGVISTEEADEMDAELTELQEGLTAQREYEMEAKKSGRRGVFVPETQASEVQEEAEPEKALKIQRKRKVKEPEPEPEPEPEKPKRKGPSVAEDDDFSDFSL